MLVVASTGLALLVLAISLMIQSRILIDPVDKLPTLGRKLQILTYVFFPLAIALLVFGVIFHQFFGPHVSVGVILLILGITLTVQSRVLVNPNGKLPLLGRQLRLSAYVCSLAGLGLVVFVLVMATIDALAG